MKAVTLQLAALGGSVPALTRALGGVQAECASVCLENQGHKEVVKLVVKLVMKDMETPEYFISRLAVTPQMRLAYADLKVATENGACGIAILLVRHLTGLTAVQRSWTGTGFDYWLGTASDPALPFENMARLEVSGILKGTASQILARKKQKLKQTEQSDATGLPGYAVIVEFGRPQADVEAK